MSYKSHYIDTSHLYSLCKSCPISTTLGMIFIGKPQGIHRRHFHIHTIRNKQLFYFLNRCRVIMELRPSPRGEDNTPQCPSNFMALCPTDAWDNIIVYMVTRKLDSESLLDWEMQIGATTEPATFEKLQKFISGRIHALEGFARATATQKSRLAAPAATKNTSGAKSHQTTAPLKSENSPNATTISSSFTCSLCNAAHYLSACPMYRGKPVAEKLDFLKQKNLCFNCLGPHQFRNCRTAKRCRVCGNPHHTSIHRTNNSSDGPAPRASATQGTSS